MLEIVLAILATYRVASMLATEEGAFGIFQSIRERIDPQQETWLGRGINCPLCIGFWVALVLALLLMRRFGLGETDTLFVWLGVAGGAALLHRWIDG